MEKNTQNKLSSTFNFIYKSPVNKSISRQVRNFGKDSERFAPTCEERERLKMPDAYKYQNPLTPKNEGRTTEFKNYSAKREVFKKIDLTPGPQDYKVPKLDFKVQNMSKNSERFLLNPEEKEKVQVPDANKYQNPLTPKNEGRTTEFKNYSAKREIFKRRESTPGPQNQEIPKSDIKVYNMSKNSERFLLTPEEKQKVQVPDANKYQNPLTPKNEGRTTEFKNYSAKREIFKRRESTPGPQNQEIPKSDIKVYNISKNSERFLLNPEQREKVKVPNANKYQNPLSARTEGRTTEFGNYSAKRVIFKRRESTPGPQNQEIPKSDIKVQNMSKNSERFLLNPEEKEKLKIPDANKYQRILTFQDNGRKTEFGNYSSRLEQHISLPDFNYPSIYHRHSKLLSKVSFKELGNPKRKVRHNNYSFGIKNDIFSLENDTPGPGQQDVFSEFSSNKVLPKSNSSKNVKM